MEIHIDERVMKKFSEVKPGEVFLKEGMLFMKLLVTSNVKDNGVYLITGGLHKFRKDEMVKPRPDLIITGKYKND